MPSEPPCPKCNRPLPMRELWEFSGYDRLGLLRKKTGIICGHCGMHLKVIQWPVFLSLALPCLNPKVVLPLSVIPALAFWLEYGPCFARVRAIKVNERLVYPLSAESWPNKYLDE
jgi:hypothetical protein